MLANFLNEGTILMHPFVSGELACGNLKNRAAILSNLNTLPTATVADNREVLTLIENRKLWGRGLGWIDMHLLASSLLSGSYLWTLDKRLEHAAIDLGIA